MLSTSQPIVIFVIGANRGIGLEVVKKLVAATSDQRKTTILFGCRDLHQGEEVLKQMNSPANVSLLQIDITSRESVAQAADEIKNKYGGQFDILINNSGISKPGLNIDVARETFAVNYFGVKTVAEYMLPLLRDYGRVVHVASEVGAWTLHEASSDLQQQYSAPTLTAEKLDELVNAFLSDVEEKKLDSSGYNAKSLYVVYGMSKAAVIALTHVLARQWSAAKNLLVVAVCPGYCSTDINNHDPAARPPELGADSILYAVSTLEMNLKMGHFTKMDKRNHKHFHAPWILL